MAECVDCAEYCRLQTYTVAYDGLDFYGDWDSYVGSIEAYSETEARNLADEHYGCDWWNIQHEGSVDPERIGR